MNYTASELLALRRQLGGLEAKNTALAVERSDGINIDTLLAIQLRHWYLDLLDHGDPRYLAPENIAAEVPAIPEGDATLIRLPERCRRAFALRLRGWERSTRILPAADLPAVLRRQNNPYTAATAARPVAVMTGEFGTETYVGVKAWPEAGGGAGAVVTELSAVVDRGDNVFILDPSALATMPQSDFLINI